MKKLRKHDPQMYERVKKKMIEILEIPHHFKPLSNALKNYRRAHVGSFVIAFRIIEDEKLVRFVAYAHHDDIYERSFNE
jgi:mRNA interferase RelE/StbE